jgi:RNA polymerase sigma-70 factor, ECF subfamily
MLLDGPQGTTELLARVRAGEGEAREQLLARYLPKLRRWAHGRLPGYARAVADTDDLIQVTLLRTLNRLDEFEPQHEGALLAYLRTVLLNVVREEIRRTGRELKTLPLDECPPHVAQTVGSMVVDSYEAALARLGERDREAVILRVEFGYTHEEIAAPLGSPSANAARMTVARALVRLAEEMDDVV